ncbi:hypothetical protein ACLBKU_13580 [Erythrobacter sp. NE805]|uniref:hypothetical protein n=1 Tax=Erythrobacter sp. NE805 TaxID=3389875 RepID=UPI00396B3F64
MRKPAPLEASVPSGEEFDDRGEGGAVEHGETVGHDRADIERLARRGGLARHL